MEFLLYILRNFGLIAFTISVIDARNLYQIAANFNYICF